MACSYAIVCDIDGVVFKGESVIDGSRECLASIFASRGIEDAEQTTMSNDAAFLFVTNDGICSEHGKALQLSSLLDLHVWMLLN
jgi:ribonucleotide monophosphatase NagD (HAD superfamily)